MADYDLSLTYRGSDSPVVLLYNIDDDGDIADVENEEWETFSAASVADYDLALSQVGTSPLWVVDVPSWISAGTRIHAVFYAMSGSSVDLTNDTILDSRTFKAGTVSEEAAGGSGGNYVSVAGLKAAKTPTGDTLTWSSWTDAEILEIIERNEALVEDYCNDIFYSLSATYTFDGNYKPCLFFPPKVRYRCLSVTTVKDIDIDGEVVETLTENDDFVRYDYYLEMSKAWPGDRPRKGVFRGGVWPVGQNNIQVAGNWGRSTTPKAITRAVELLCMVETHPDEIAVAPSGVVQASWPDFTATFAGSKVSAQSGTGYVEIDRMLQPYVNLSSLFVVM